MLLSPPMRQKQFTGIGHINRADKPDPPPAINHPLRHPRTARKRAQGRTPASSQNPGPESLLIHNWCWSRCVFNEEENAYFIYGDAGLLVQIFSCLFCHPWKQNKHGPGKRRAGARPGCPGSGCRAVLAVREQLYRGGGMQAESVKRQSSGGGAGTLLGSAQGMDESLSGAADPRVLPRSWCPALVLHLLCWEEMETHHGTARC